MVGGGADIAVAPSAVVLAFRTAACHLVEIDAGAATPRTKRGGKVIGRINLDRASVSLTPLCQFRSSSATPLDSLGATGPSRSGSSRTRSSLAESSGCAPMRAVTTIHHLIVWGTLYLSSALSRHRSVGNERIARRNRRSSAWRWPTRCGAARSGHGDLRLYRRDAVLAVALDEYMRGDLPLAELARARSQEYINEDVTRQDVAARAAQDGGGPRQLLRSRHAQECGRRRRRRCG